ncbi:MAG: LptF/LptG family permease, partial [Cytophagales bacterium]|nr:LptF/LptG family permease [Cytophagales bacterium]
MKIIDKYIGKKFLSTFFFISILVMFLIFIFDYMQKGNYFFENHLSRKEIFDYYKAYVPYMLNFIIPVIIFVTTIFTTSQLTKRSEILAILGTGISYGRLLVSFLKPAILLTAASFYVNGWVIARNNEKWIYFEEQYIDNYDSNSTQNNLHLKINGNRYITIGKYKSLQKIGMKILLDTFENDELQTRITAEKMLYDDKADTWILHNWTQRELQKDGELLTSGDRLSPDI